MNEYYDLINNSNSLEELFSHWENKEPENGINHKENLFIPDGIVNPDVWNDSKHKRILYVLKEAYDRKDLIHWLSFNPERQMWNRVAAMTYAIQHTTETSIPAYSLDIYQTNAKIESMNQIAVLNLKKSAGKSQSSSSEIAMYAEADRKEIIKEIKLIDPEIVVCGSTFKTLYSKVFEKEPMEESEKNINWFYYKNLDGKKRLYLDVYHPAKIGDTDLGVFYTIAGIYQQALKKSHS